jgi:hypothetical protein
MLITVYYEELKSCGVDDFDWISDEKEFDSLEKYTKFMNDLALCRRNFRVMCEIGDSIEEFYFFSEDD